MCDVLVLFSFSAHLSTFIDTMMSSDGSLLGMYVTVALRMCSARKKAREAIISQTNASGNSGHLGI